MHIRLLCRHVAVRAIGLFRNYVDMKKVLGVYLSHNGAMKDFVASYKSMSPDDTDWLDQSGSKFKPTKLVALANDYTEVKFVNGEYRPGLLLFCILLKLYRYLGLGRCHVTVTWHDVTPHHMKIFDITLWLVSLFSSLLSDKTIVHNKNFVDAWHIKFFKINTIYRPLPLLNYIEPLPISLPDGLLIEDCIVFFGRIEAYKGLNELIDTYKRFEHKSCKHLLILGKLPSAISEKICNDGRIYSIPQYLSEAELAFVLKSSCAVVMPYKHFSQSNHPYWAAMYDCSLYASDIVNQGLSDIAIDGYYELQLTKNSSCLDKAQVTNPLVLDIKKIETYYE
jgi:glycosyltransferase involved in cell wall biosynthesis